MNSKKPTIAITAGKMVEPGRIWNRHYLELKQAEDLVADHIDTMLAAHSILRPDSKKTLTQFKKYIATKISIAAFPVREAQRLLKYYQVC